MVKKALDKSILVRDIPDELFNYILDIQHDKRKKDIKISLGHIALELMQLGYKHSKKK